MGTENLYGKLRKLYNFTVTSEVLAVAYTKDRIPENVLYQNIELFWFLFF